MATIDQALTDPALLGAALGNPASWSAWLTILRACFGLPLDPKQAAAFSVLAGGRSPPTQQVREAWLIAGRRSGKTRMAAAVAVFLACLVDHSQKLSAGEVGHLLVLAPSVDQAHMTFSYARAFIEQSPLLRDRIREIRADEIVLDGGICLAVHSASHRTIRGRTVIGAVLDEVSMFRSETSAVPDWEIYRALAPSMLTTGGVMLGISTPYSQRGLLFDKFKAAYGQDDATTLVIRAESTALNPTLDQAEINRAVASDPEANVAEYEAQFRNDLASYISRAVIENCTDTGVTERPFVRRHRHAAFCDPSGGSSDSMTLAICHREGARCILDKLCEARAPHGDKYSGEWVRSEFGRHGISYLFSERTKSQIYLDSLPLLNGGLVLLLDDVRLKTQILLLERRPGRGQDIVDHPRGGKDDLANAALGALTIRSWHNRDPDGNRMRARRELVADCGERRRQVGWF